MRISDWSSDVCSSDLLAQPGVGLAQAMLRQMQQGQPARVADAALDGALQTDGPPRPVAALLDVLRNNRARARALAAAEGAPAPGVVFVSRMSGAHQDAARQTRVPASQVGNASGRE